MEDQNNNLWIGTHNQGLFKYNLDSGETSHFHQNGDDFHQISTNIIYRLLEDAEGRIWIGTIMVLIFTIRKYKKHHPIFLPTKIQLP
jgi:ligand-binding sensor domain-containing protein